MSMLDHIGDEFSELTLSELAICCKMLNAEIKRREFKKKEET